MARDSSIERRIALQTWLHVATLDAYFLDVGRSRVVKIDWARASPDDIFTVPCMVLETGETFCTNFENLRILTPLEVLAVAAS